ncbi:MAG: hypothetical protein IPK78_00635 [Rhodospirillales bacterium]|nr:hypothetical protein [Rhodospirillales bacterium]
MPDQKVRMGELTFVIDQNAGTQNERDALYNDLLNLSFIPEYKEALKNTVHMLPNAEVMVAGSSNQNDLLLTSQDGTPILDENNNPEYEDQASNISHGTTTESGTLLSYAKIYINLSGISTSAYTPQDGGAPVNETVACAFTNELGSIVGKINEGYLPPGAVNNPLWNNTDNWGDGVADSEYTGRFEDICHKIFNDPFRGAEDSDYLTGLPTHNPYYTLPEWLSAWAKGVQDYQQEELFYNGAVDWSGISVPPLVENLQAILGGLSNWFNNLLDNGDGRHDPNQNDSETPPPPPDLFFPFDLTNKLFGWPPKSPLVLDADLSSTVDLSALGDTTTYFDMDGDGQAELTAWATGGDGFLTRDLNANGRIDDGTELFGTAGGAEDGFAALRALDSDSDGKITDQDAAWGELSVWLDANMDGVTQAGELHTLSDIGIASISLNATLESDAEIAGNQITHSSTFTTADEQVYGIVDAWFDYEPGVTRNNEDFTLDLRAAFLPTLRGFGEIKDLHIAASIDNTGTGNLMDMLSDLALSISGPAGAFGDWADIKTDVEALLLKWAGVDGVDPDSRGVHVDARHLEFYEAFTGTPFTQYGQPDPLIEAGAMLEAMFDYIVTYSTTQIVAQVIGADVFETAPTYSLFTGAMEGDFVLSQTALDAITAEAVSSGDAVGVWTQFAQFLGYVEGLDSIGAGDLAALDTAVAATSDPLLDDWSDVVTRMTATMGGIIDSADDWGSFEVYYDNIINGTSAGETLTGSNDSNDQITAYSGNDTLYGLSGHDKLAGGDGNDTLDGGDGDDFL